MDSESAPSTSRLGVADAEPALGQLARELRSRRALFAVPALAAVAAIGWLDVLTGPDLGLSLLYLLPVVACGFWIGPTTAAAAAIAAAGCWLGVDIASHENAYAAVSLWNGMTRLAIFGAMGLGAARVRADRSRLEGLNARLRELADQEAHLARIDPVTGLPNRRAFLETLDSEVARCRRRGEGLCVASLDLDGFKAVNDTLGHAAGDALLRAVGKAMQVALRRTDLVARLGGDEFAVLLWKTSVADATRTARRLLEAVAGASRELGGPLVGASVGLAYLDPAPMDPAESLEVADAALYAAKRGGKGRVVVLPEAVASQEAGGVPAA